MSSATKKRDLRSGTSVWSHYRAAAVATEPLVRDQKTDVLIVGSGISGAMVAENLTAAGLSVLLLDRRRPMKGSTPASTALLQYEIDEPLTALQKKLGKDDAARAWRRSKLALESLATRVRFLSLPCHMTRRPSLYLAGDTLDADALRIEGEARMRIGLETSYLDAAALKERYGIKRKAALLSLDNVAADPRQLTAGFLNVACRRGAIIYSPVEVTDVESHRGSVSVLTKDGPIISAKAVIFASGYEMPKMIDMSRHQIISTWAIATKPQPRKLWPEQAFIWEASDPYLYARTTHDGRVICGGEDEEFSDEETRDALLMKKTGIISKKLGKLFPQIDPTPVDRWTASFGASETGLPSIGAVPGHRGVYAVMGYGGNGITYSRLGAEILRSLLTGRRDPDQDLFAFK